MGNDYNLNLWNKAAIGLKAAWNCNKSIEKLFNKADTNGSGGLDKDEVSKLLNSWKLGSIFNVDDVFNGNNENGTIGVDADRSGDITLDEVLEYAKKMGYNWSSDTKLKQAMLDVKNGFGSKPSMGLDDNTASTSEEGVVPDLQNAGSTSSKRPSGPRALNDEEIAENVDYMVKEYRDVCHEQSFAKFADHFYTSIKAQELTEEDLSAMSNYFEANRQKYDLPAYTPN